MHTMVSFLYDFPSCRAWILTKHKSYVFLHVIWDVINVQLILFAYFADLLHDKMWIITTEIKKYNRQFEIFGVHTQWSRTLTSVSVYFNPHIWHISAALNSWSSLFILSGLLNLLPLFLFLSTCPAWTLQLNPHLCKFSQVWNICHCSSIQLNL